MIGCGENTALLFAVFPFKGTFLAMIPNLSRLLPASASHAAISEISSNYRILPDLCMRSEGSGYRPGDSLDEPAYQ
jgi:hypothetical protein